MKSKVPLILIAIGFIILSTTAKRIFPKDATSKTVTFIATSALFSFEEENLKDFTFYNASIAFKDFGSVQIEMTLLGKASLTIQTQDSMMCKLFLDEPIDIFMRILNFNKVTLNRKNECEQRYCNPGGCIIYTCSCYSNNGFCSLSTYTK